MNPGEWILVFLGRYNPVDLIAIVVMLGAVLWLWLISVSKSNTYDFSDNFKDPFTNKASNTALVYLFMAGLSVWWVVRNAVDGGDPSNVLLAILGIFIAKAGADRAISAWGVRTPDKAPDPPAVVDSGPQVAEAAPDVSVQVLAPAEIKTVTTVKGKKAGG